MEVKDALDIMNSDFKLWERAVDTELGGGKMAKTLTLPWGIGEYTVTMEGMNNAEQRRNAVSEYGKHIRYVIDERTNDEGIVGRAQVAAARTEQDDSEDSVGSDRGVGVRDEAPLQDAREETGEACKEDAEEPEQFGADFAARRLEVESRLSQLHAAATRAERELRVIKAALKAMEDE